jgi:hypothetical protein
VPGESERRELCGRIKAEDYPKYRVVVRQGEDPDGGTSCFQGSARCSSSVRRTMIPRSSHG